MVHYSKVANMSKNQYIDLLDFAGINTKEDEKLNSQLTVLSFGGGQDSTTILLKLIFDKDFRIKYAPNNLLVLFADTGNEHPFTYDYIKRVIEPLCAKHNIEFVKITNDMGFHGRTWKTLTYQWRLNTPTIGSMGFPNKSCTHNLKLNPQYNYLGDRLSRLFQIPKGNKKEYEYYAKQNGRIRFLIGIAKNEEKRVNGYWYINFDDNKIQGKIKTVKGVEYFVSIERYYEISYSGSNRYVNIQNKQIQIEFQYDVIYDASWKEKALITEYPLVYARAVYERERQDRNRDSNSINTAITWSSTPEGHAFWEAVHNNYMETAKKICPQLFENSISTTRGYSETVNGYFK